MAKATEKLKKVQIIKACVVDGKKVRPAREEKDPKDDKKKRSIPADIVEVSARDANYLKAAKKGIILDDDDEPQTGGRKRGLSTQSAGALVGGDGA